MVDPSQNFDVFMDETEINENEEMEIEFTPVETRKKTRSPSPTKTTPSVATTNHYDILSDEEEDPKEKATDFDPKEAKDQVQVSRNTPWVQVPQTEERKEKKTRTMSLKTTFWLKQSNKTVNS